MTASIIHQGLIESYAGLRDKRFITIINKIGLGSNLKLCLDAGDADSYSGSGQSWLDRSGSGYDFLRGTTSSSESSDPTFNGASGGLSSSEYWSFNGSQFFTYDSPNEAWMNNLHKSGAKFTLLAWIYIVDITTAIRMIAGTSGTSASNIGIQFRTNITGTVGLIVQNGSGTNALVSNSSPLTVSAGAWHMVGVSVDVGGASGNFIVDADTQSFSPSYSSPSASSSTFTMQLAANGTSANQFDNGSRMGMMAAFEGAALSAAQMTAIFNSTRDRFGV